MKDACRYFGESHKLNTMTTKHIMAVKEAHKKLKKRLRTKHEERRIADVRRRRTEEEWQNYTHR